jgi:hypothetical protein
LVDALIFNDLISDYNDKVGGQGRQRDPGGRPGRPRSRRIATDMKTSAHYSNAALRVQVAVRRNRKNRRTRRHGRDGCGPCA